MANNNSWADALAGDAPAAQVEALRRIAGQESVTGLTVSIIALSGSSDEDVQMWSAEALETAVEPSTSEVIPLIEVLQSADHGEIRYWAATMLGRLGTDAVAAVAALETCLRESRYLPARERAVWALSQIGPQAAAAVPALKAAAAGAPPRLQRLATEALRVISGEIAA